MEVVGEVVRLHGHGFCWRRVRERNGTDGRRCMRRRFYMHPFLRLGRSHNLERHSIWRKDTSRLQVGELILV
jgi:hypothetical protein